MRALCLLLPLALLAACDPPPPDAPTAFPDAAVAINCEGGFAFLAPRPELHYDPDLVVIADMAPFYADGLPGIEAVDDLGNGYAPTAAASSTALADGEVELRWSLQLAAGRRYTLYFSATECEQTIEFFTSAP